MKRIFTCSSGFFAVMVLLSLNSTVWAQSEEQIERLNEERKAFFEEKLELTPAESKAFWPLYDDFMNRKIRIMEDQKNTFRYSQKNADNLSQKEIEETLGKILLQKTQMCELEQEYYGDKFPSVLPPKKVLLLYRVEWDFRQHLLKEIRGGGPEGKGHGAQRGGPGGAPGGGPGIPGGGTYHPGNEVFPGNGALPGGEAGFGDQLPAPGA
jgi:hypothetical protein